MNTRPVLVLNAGSSSLKYQVVRPDTGRSLAGGHVERLQAGEFEQALRTAREALATEGIDQQSLAAVGHRVVHGGQRYVSATLVDDEVLAGLEEVAHMAPLHNPPAIAAIRQTMAAYPELPQVAVFDTGYFADLPSAAATYAIDAGLAQQLGIRRYGMHGISHQYVAQAAADFLERDLDHLDQVILHLGNGASASAVSGGRPVETSMGLTPLEGLVMGTRAGDIDPGVLLHLMRVGDLGVDELDDLLNHRSGLRGLCGIQDFRDLVKAADAGDGAARTAYDVYCHRLRKYVGAYHAVLGGADVITFTAGTGENVARVRRDVLAGLDRLGIRIDPDRNEVRGGPARISTDDSSVTVLVVPTDEELSIAREVAELLA